MSKYWKLGKIKKQEMECEKKPRKKIASSCTDLTGDHGAHRQDERWSYGQKWEREKKRREGHRRRRDEGEEEREQE